MEDVKIKLAALWIVLEFGVITLTTVQNYLIHIEEMIADTTTPEVMTGITIAFLIPPIMAFLSLTLKDSINRWLNIILGILFIVFMPLGSPVFPTAYLPSFIIIIIVEIVALALIVWHAWKWPKKEG